MAAEFDVSTSKKRRLDIFDTRICAFCTKPFNEKSPGISPNLQKIESLFSSCAQRDDEVGKEILSHRDQILEGTVVFRYHRNCRSSYTSSSHLKRITKSEIEEGSPSTSTGACFTRSQSSISNFDWKENCFLCGLRCHPKKRSTWSMVQSAIGSKSDGSDMYTKVWEAAELSDDQEMSARLNGIPNGDLVAIESRYHRTKNGYLKYISEQRILAQKKAADNDNAIQLAITQLIEEFRPSVEDGKEVFLLTTLKARFQELLARNGMENFASYQTKRFKKQLAQEWSELSFIPQPGMSDLVCSRSISVGEALFKARQLSQLLEEVADIEDACERSQETSEDNLIHQAVGILRRRLSQARMRADEYPSCKEMSPDQLKAWIDPLIYKVVGWLTDKQLYDDAADASAMDSDLRRVNLACDLTTQATSVSTLG